MTNNKMSRQTQDDQDLNLHGVKDIIPENEEYYTLDLKRGDDTDADDIPEIDIADKDPANNDSDVPLKSSSFYEGQVVQKKNHQNDDSFDQNTTGGKVAGTPGHWGNDEETE
jgi:hypothetical protein